jgi:hypothetical protein
MSKGAHVTLGHPQIKTGYMLHLGFNWKPKHFILDLFKVAKPTGQVLAKSLVDLLDAYGLRNKIIAYVKGEGSNLNTLTSALNFVVKCETLGLEESF